MTRPTLEERLWSKTDRDGPLPKWAPFLGPCWVWTKPTNTYGYAQITKEVDRRSVALMAHRVAYELLVGPIPEGLVIDHLCRVRPCVNPSHLEPVTNAENLRRGRSGQFNAAKTHCKHGHAFSPENTHRDALGRRRCRACDRAAQQRRRDAAKAAA